jgi:hypothetical protein
MPRASLRRKGVKYDLKTGDGEWQRWIGDVLSFLASRAWIGDTSEICGRRTVPRDGWPKQRTGSGSGASR